MPDRKPIYAFNVYVAIMRVSTDKKKQGDAEALSIQEEKIDKWAAEQGVGLIKLPAVVESGKIRFRSSVEQAIAIVKSGRARGIVSTKVDRVSRRLSEVTRIEEELLAANADWKCTDQTIDIWTIEGRFMLHTLGAVAEFEADTTAARTAVQRKHAQKQNRYVGGLVPFGYEIREVGEGDSKVKFLEPLDAEQELIAKVVEWRDVEKVSFQTIADRLAVATNRMWHLTSAKNVYLRAKNKEEVA